MKITPTREKRDAVGGLFLRGVIFTRARVSLALLSLRTNGGLLVVYLIMVSKFSKMQLNYKILCQDKKLCPQACDIIVIIHSP